MAYASPYMPQMPVGYYPPQRPQDFGSQMQQPAQTGFVVRPVASPEEAKAIPTDFSGAVTLMPDLPHGVIYVKVLNYNDGTSVFASYRLDVPPPPPEYATRQELESLRAEIARLTEGAVRYDVPGTASDAAR